MPRYLVEQLATDVGWSHACTICYLAKVSPFAKSVSDWDRLNIDRLKHTTSATDLPRDKLVKRRIRGRWVYFHPYQ